MTSGESGRRRHSPRKRDPRLEAAAKSERGGAYHKTLVIYLSPPREEVRNLAMHADTWVLAWAVNPREAGHGHRLLLLLLLAHIS